MRALRIHEAATDEAAEAAAWYEKERPGLGAEFEHAVDAALDLLEDTFCIQHRSSHRHFLSRIGRAIPA